MNLLHKSTDSMQSLLNNDGLFKINDFVTKYTKCNTHTLVVIK